MENPPTSNPKLAAIERNLLRSWQVHIGQNTALHAKMAELTFELELARELSRADVAAALDPAR